MSFPGKVIADRWCQQAEERDERRGAAGQRHRNRLVKRILVLMSTAAVAASMAFVGVPAASADQFVCGYWIRGAIEAKWLRKGGLGGPLGCPTSDELVNPDGDGRRNHFGDRGHIYWRNYTGAHPVWGDIAFYWAAAGWERSMWRYPVSDEFSQFASGFWFFWQDFECGRIQVSQGFPTSNYTCV